VSETLPRARRDGDTSRSRVLEALRGRAGDILRPAMPPFRAELLRSEAALQLRPALEERRWSSAWLRALALVDRRVLHDVLPSTVLRVLLDQPVRGLAFAPRRSRSYCSSFCSTAICWRRSASSMGDALRALAGESPWNGEEVPVPIFSFHRAISLVASVRRRSYACDESCSSFFRESTCFLSLALLVASSAFSPVNGEAAPSALAVEVFSAEPPWRSRCLSSVFSCRRRDTISRSSLCQSKEKRSE
jgi:hypothetical protein